MGIKTEGSRAIIAVVGGREVLLRGVIVAGSVCADAVVFADSSQCRSSAATTPLSARCPRECTQPPHRRLNNHASTQTKHNRW